LSGWTLGILTVNSPDATEVEIEESVSCWVEISCWFS
jgi:hypothetical protein